MVMGFFQMHFQCRAELERAFATVLGYEDLEFCAADSSQLRLRFRTRPGCAGPLLERLGIEQEPRPDGVQEPGPASGR
jgi:hypothetical protein